MARIRADHKSKPQGPRERLKLSKNFWRCAGQAEIQFTTETQRAQRVLVNSLQAVEDAAWLISFSVEAVGGFLGTSVVGAASKISAGGQSISRNRISTISLIIGDACSCGSRNCLGSKSVFFRLQAAVCRAKSTRPARLLSMRSSKTASATCWMAIGMELASSSSGSTTGELGC